MLSNKTVVLGVTGGIAAYKSAALASRLVKSGANLFDHYRRNESDSATKRKELFDLSQSYLSASDNEGWFILYIHEEWKICHHLSPFSASIW